MTGKTTKFEMEFTLKRYYTIVLCGDKRIGGTEFDGVYRLYMALMLRWGKSAPPDKHEGLLDGKLARNTQITRMAYILRKIATIEKSEGRCIYQFISKQTVRRDGNSYISKETSWMEDPHPLSDGWFFEGCTSLEQKQGILRHLARWGLPRALVNCIEDFIAGKSIENYMPRKEGEEVLCQFGKESEYLLDMQGHIRKIQVEYRSNA